MLQARSAAFVVEQACVFQEIDGADPLCWHLVGYRGKELVATARLLPAGTKFAEPSIGRVITVGSARGTGLGRELMRQALKQADKLWPGKPVRIGAQARLEKFYEDFGFVTASAPYIEDGIPHLEMLRPASMIPDKAGQTVGQ